MSSTKEISERIGKIVAIIKKMRDYWMRSPSKAVPSIVDTYLTKLLEVDASCSGLTKGGARESALFLLKMDENMRWLANEHIARIMMEVHPEDEKKPQALLQAVYVTEFRGELSKIADAMLRIAQELR